MSLNSTLDVLYAVGLLTILTGSPCRYTRKKFICYFSCYIFMKVNDFVLFSDLVCKGIIVTRY
uniref:Uncharacterized protein n=1 Tax=Rhodnius prolixus TaxID=13249 RepID=T1HZ70_RHOPR